jgi:hypothetical protein
LFNAGVLRQALGQNDKAIAHYKDYAKRYADRKDAPDVAFNIGVVYEGAGQEGPAYQAYSDYSKVYKSSGKRIIEAYTRAGRLAYRLGQLKKANDDFAAAQALFKHASGKEKSEGKTWAAEARYYDGELILRDYEKVSLDVKPSQLNKALTTKKKLLDQAEKVYFSVVDYQDLKWATASLYRVGQIYDQFAEAIANAAAKPPASLKPDEVQIYQDRLNDVVLDIQKQAETLYSTGYGKAIQMQVYDEYTAKIREALGRLSPKKYAPEREARAKGRSGDRPPNPELITEVAR